jgi:Predicted membrane protein
MNEPTAQMGFQVGKSAMAAGQEYMENNVCNIEGTLFATYS